MSGLTKRKLVSRALMLPVALGMLALGWTAPTLAQTYLGSEVCAGCHYEQYNDFRVSGHPYKLTKSEIAREKPIPLPEGITWDDVSYMIGGYKWKARFMGNDGFIITTLPDGTEGQNQYNILTGNWVDYHPGEEKPYDCGRCHTTGFSPAGNQDGLPGILGTWALEGIQCEACHGPGAHFNPANEQIIDRSSAACGACHVRSDPATIPASGGFIRHHEQYNEILASPHAALDCVDCHNPHKKSDQSIVTTCEDCHSNIAAAYAGTVMDRWNVECEDCHMPMATKSAEALGPYKGDVKTHLFRIETDANASMFTPDGSLVALDGDGKAKVTVDFACLSCHLTESRSWASFYSRNFHGVEAEASDPVRTPPRLIIPRRGPWH